MSKMEFLDPLEAKKFTKQKCIQFCWTPFKLAIFLHSINKNGTLGTQRLTLIGSRTRLGPLMNPAMALQYTQHDPKKVCLVDE